jgi:hypothetical protein
MLKVRLEDPKNRVNFVYSTDWHLSEIPLGRRKDDYKAAILSKVEFIRGLTERLHGAALCGADVFHYKQPKHIGNSISSIIALLNILRRFPQGCVYGAVGNHDLSYDRMDSLPHQPLGLLIEVGAYYDLNKAPVLFTNADESIKVLVETFPYADESETLMRLQHSGPRMPGTHRIGIVHAYGHPGDAGSMFGARTIGYNELKDVDFDFLLWGHDHSRHETETVGICTHVNLGSLARAAYTYDERERPVVATVLSFAADGVRYKEMPIPVKPIDTVFITADKGVERVQKSEEVKAFFSAMDDAVDGLESTDPLTVIQEVCKDEPKLLTLLLGLCGYE